MSSLLLLPVPLILYASTAKIKFSLLFGITPLPTIYKHTRFARVTIDGYCQQVTTMVTICIAASQKIHAILN